VLRDPKVENVDLCRDFSVNGDGEEKINLNYWTLINQLTNVNELSSRLTLSTSSPSAINDFTLAWPENERWCGGQVPVNLLVLLNVELVNHLPTNTHFSESSSTEKHFLRPDAADNVFRFS
jgi:hypothetical protein